MSLIQNDKRIVHSAAAHKCKWCNLNNSLFNEVICVLHGSHIKKRIVERPNVGIQFFLKRAWKKAERLSCFYNRSYQHNSADLLRSQSGKCHSNCQIRFTCSCRTNTKGNRVVCYCLCIRNLTLRFRLNSFSLMGDKQCTSSCLL